MAIVSGIYLKDGTLVIVSADSTSKITKDEEQVSYLHQHFSKLRDIGVLANSNVILIVESNYGGAIGASRIADICAEFQPLSAMTRDTSKERKCGVTTTAPVKERMRVELQKLLRHNAVRFATEFTSVETGSRDAVCSQLRGFRFHVVENKSEGGDPNKRSRIVLTGKGAGSNDDLTMAVMMLSFWPAEYWSHGAAALVNS
jgi:hypothetical protein